MFAKQVCQEVVQMMGMMGPEETATRTNRMAKGCAHTMAREGQRAREQGCVHGTGARGRNDWRGQAGAHQRGGP